MINPENHVRSTASAMSHISKRSQLPFKAGCGVFWVATGIAAGLTGGLARQAQAGLTFKTTFDTSVSSRSDYAQIQAAWTYATNQVSNFFSNNMVVNIAVSASASVGLGGSTTNLQAASYAQVQTALNSHKTSSADISSMATMADPTGNSQFYVPLAQAKVLGLRPTNDTSTDGIFSFSSTQAYGFLGNRAAAGTYDWTAVALHEISEILGRNAGLGVSIGTSVASYMPYDLFRFTAPGVGLSGSGPMRFSAQIRPLCARTISRVIARPSPELLPRLVVAVGRYV